MNDFSKFISKMEELGELYYSDLLEGVYDINKLDQDWWEGLKFFFGHTFFRGRRDELSNEFFFFAVSTLKEHLNLERDGVDKAFQNLLEHQEEFGSRRILDFKQKYKIGRKNALKHTMFQEEIANKNPTIIALTTPAEVLVEWDEVKNLKLLSLTNGEDLMMVLDVLKFITSEGRQNIYLHLKSIILEKGIDAAYNTITSMRAIKDKLASLVIRDIGLINKGLINGNFEKTFPVDTLVWQIAEKLGCGGTSIS